MVEDEQEELLTVCERDKTVVGRKESRRAKRNGR